MTFVRQFVSLAALSSIALMGCHQEEHEHHATASLKVTSPKRQATELTEQYVAQVRAIQHIEMRAMERGYLEGVFVDEGQHLKAGQKMFQLMPRILQAEVAKEQAEADRAELELTNTKLLADQDIVSPNELALAKANFARATAQLDLAKAHRGLTEIRAPFAGIMGRFMARQGSLLDEGDLLTTMSDNSTVWVYFNVSERDYLRFKAEKTEEQRPVRLRMANGELFDQPGAIETIEADFDNETGTIAFRAAFPNPDGLLRHGETGTIELTVPFDDALLIPQQATFDVLDRKFVYVVDKAGVLHSVAITVAAELPHIYLVGSGVTADDRILIEGLRKVHEGSTINPVFEDPEVVLTHLETPAE